MGVFRLPCKVVFRCTLGLVTLMRSIMFSSIIAGRRFAWPFPLVNDGDLLLKVQQMVRCRGYGNACVTKAKGHADEGLVALDRVREADRIGNN